MSNVVVRRNKSYACNIDYGGIYYPLDFNSLDCGKNKFDNFIESRVKSYKFPYPDGTDIYVSDAGVYFPSQYCNELNKRYPYLAVFQALSRHVGDCNFHVNSQSLNRVWDKIREQSDIYILCRRCFYLKGLVIQFVTLYDKYQSALDRQRPLKLPGSFLGSSEAKMIRKTTLAQYEAAHGMIKDGILIYRNRSTYDTRRFKSILEEGHEDQGS